VFHTDVPENQLRLARLLSVVTVDLSSFMDLRLWVLTVSALAEEGEPFAFIIESVNLVIVSLQLFFRFPLFYKDNRGKKITNNFHSYHFRISA